MRVPTSTIPDSLVSQLQKLTAQQVQLQNQVSTGVRFTQASDDPAAMSRMLGVEAEQHQIQQFQKNNDRALAISQTTYATVDQLRNISTRAGELATLGSGVNSPVAAKSYATELNQLIEQAVQIGNTKYSGDYVLGGTKTDTQPFAAVRDVTGNVTGVIYGGSATGAQIAIGEQSTVSPYTDGATNQKVADFINHLVSLRDALNTGNAANVQTIQPALQSSEDDLLTTISNIGAVQTRLEADASQNQARFTELNKLASSETDVDVAQTVTKLAQTQTAYQAALQSGAKILQTSLLDYLR